MFWKKSKKRILLIDDEPDVLDLIKSRLEINDYEVITALNGEEGIKRAQEVRPDLILLDIIMPGKDGFEVCRELKVNFSTKDIPVIFLSAKGREDDAFEGLRLGAVNYIVKPYDPKELLDKVDKALKGK